MHNIFISWSGKSSHAAAEAFAEWLPCVLQSAIPWFSPRDIDRGSVWFSEISSKLAGCNIGVLFVTRENQLNPWLLFEAGALSKGLSESRVCTFLVDLNVRDIDRGSPLAQLNHSSNNKSDVLKLLKTINLAMEDKKVDEGIISRTFEAMWPDLEARLIAALEGSKHTDTKPERTDEDVLNEILERVLRIDHRLNRQLDSVSQPESRRILPKSVAESMLAAMLTDGADREEIEQAFQGRVPVEWLDRRLNRE